VPGTKVLSQIVQIRPLELIVSLPNQLLAHIPITNISPEYTKRLEASADDSASDDSDDDSDDEDGAASKRLPELPSLFKEGDWVSGVVVATKSADARTKLGGREGDENVRASRRVELSLEPEKVNEGVARGDLKTGFTIVASVKSVEDHGYILSLGLESLTSFLPFKEAKKLQDRALQVGQIVACRIKDVNENGKTCNVTVGRAEVTGSALASATTITSVLPGTLVTALVTATLSSGLNVKFFGYFDGTIDLFHLDGRDPENDFKIGQKIRCRVLWDSIGGSTKKFALSAAKHVLELAVAKVGTTPVDDAFPIGTTIEHAKVVRLDDEWGLTVEFVHQGIPVTGFVHISRITDDHLGSIPKASPWKVGTVHRARVIGYSTVDGLIQLSLQPTVLEQAFLRVSDVKVGEIVKGTIKRLSDSALFVSISGNVDGVVWPMHYADIKLKHPEKKFKAGASVKARIYAADPIKNRVVLTLKKQLITSELPIISSVAEAKAGTITHATVSKILDKGVLVDFYNGLRAIIPAAEAAEKFTADLSSIFSVGNVIAVRLISVDKETGKMVASAKQALTPAASSTGLDSIEIGTVTTGEVTALHDTTIVLALAPAKVKALISYATLARYRSVTVEALKESLAKGQTIEDLVVVSKNADKGLVIVGLVPSKAAAAPKAGAATDDSNHNLTFDNLTVGQVVSGRVCGKVPSGLLVQVSRQIRGRVGRNEIGDNYDELVTPATAMGAHVKAVVLSIDTEYKRVDLSLRPSRLDAEVKAKDVAVSTVSDLAVGQKIRGFVKNIANGGVFVSLGAEVTARVQIKELFDEFVKEWKPKFAVGQLVEGKILAVDKVNNQVEMSLRKNAAVKASTLEVGDLVKGQVVKGVVKRVEGYGAFIRINGSNINGLCHKTKVTDDEDADWTECIKPGDSVRCIVMDVNKETKKISLGVKHSLFENAEVDNEESEEDEDEEELEELEGDEDDEEEEEDAEMGEEDDEEDDSDAVMGEVDFDSGDEDESEEEIAPVASTSKLPAPVKAAPLAIKAGFDWDGNDKQEDKQADVDSDSDEEEVIPAANGKAAARKDLSTLEDKTGELESTAPTSVADFERLLLGSPNSSFLWIQFVAFYVGLSQLDKAREVGRRALSAINFREEGEKLNVWVALLNLENAYGTQESLDELFKEAIQMNDAKTVHLKLVDILERAAKYEQEEDLFKRVVKKFGQSSKAWTLFAQFYLTRGRADEARALLPRSLKSLEKRKHVKTISKFAQLEFKLGEAERGRTIFEGVMDSYPKRLDLWFVYIDMEIRQRNVAAVRALFERVLQSKLSSKKGKSVFKKWLAFEKEHGDEQGVQAVKEKAVAFVQALGA